MGTTSELADDFLSGVIEGFYGQPWSQSERLELFRWMAERGLDTYLYAPKDDLKHRALWREPYSDSELSDLSRVVRAAAENSIRFIYAISPGLDIGYSDSTELQFLQKRVLQLGTGGVSDFALLFDDIPDRMSAVDAARWPSFASAQAHIANHLFESIQEGNETARFLFCPTPYCGRMAAAHLGGEDYLETIGRELHPEIDIFWTGPEIISREITVDHIRDVARILRRKPVIWDNLHANDYDGRRFYCGPYAGREPSLRSEVRGILSNPNNEFPLNYIPLRTLGEFVRCNGSWDARGAYKSAMEAWHAQFETIGAGVSLDDLILFGDVFYLPYDNGPEAEGLLRRLRDAIKGGAMLRPEIESLRRDLGRLRTFCGQMTELRNRGLFYALSRRIWEVREEVDLLDRYLEACLSSGRRVGEFSSDAHLPSTFRGGWVAEIQELLGRQPDGTFAPFALDDSATAPRLAAKPKSTMS